MVCFDYHSDLQVLEDLTHSEINILLQNLRKMEQTRYAWYTVEKKIHLQI